MRAEIISIVRPVVMSVVFNWIRYIVLSGGAFFALWVLRDRVQKYKIQAADAKRAQIMHDIFWSLSTAAIQGTLTTLLILSGHTRIYHEVSKYGWPYLFASVIAVLLTLDMYFYFSHRLLHWKPLLKRIHITHHRNKVPTAFSTIAFHPGESLIQWLVFPLIVCTFPCHWMMLVTVFGFTFLVNNLGHLGYEFYPAGLPEHPILRWSNSSTFHNMHHSHVNCNFGLYFAFLDRAFGTLHPDYPKLYARVKSKSLPGRSLTESTSFRKQQRVTSAGAFAHEKLHCQLIAEEGKAQFFRG